MWTPTLSLISLGIPLALSLLGLALWLFLGGLLCTVIFAAGLVVMESRSATRKKKQRLIRFSPNIQRTSYEPLGPFPDDFLARLRSPEANPKRP